MNIHLQYLLIRCREEFASEKYSEWLYVVCWKKFIFKNMKKITINII